MTFTTHTTDRKNHDGPAYVTQVYVGDNVNIVKESLPEKPVVKKLALSPLVFSYNT